MSKFRRRLMSLITEPEEEVYGGNWEYYITDGRTLLLDGKSKGSTTAWVSKTGSVSFNKSGATFKENHVYFDGVDDYLYNTSFSPTGSGTGTIEVVIEDDGFGTRTALVFMGKTNSGLGFGKTSANLILYSVGATGRARPVATVARASYSINASRRFENGVAMSTSGTDYWVGRVNTNFIGRRNSGNYFKGKIYSIRMYNRLITKDEALRNLSIDNIRFRLNLASYSQREYIQTNGSAYLPVYISNGGYRAGTPPMSMEVKVSCVPEGTDNQYICGCTHGTDLRFFLLGVSTTSKKAFVGYADDDSESVSVSISDSLTNSTPFIAKTVLSDGFQSISIKQEGETEFTTATGSVAGGVTGNMMLTILALNNEGTFGNYAKPNTKLYYIKLYDDATFTNCILHGIPCLYFGVYGLWDLVTNSFIGRYKSSSGTLTGGPAV